MAMGRISVPLSTDEREALIRIAEVECRDPRDQMRYMLREEGQRRGLISGDEQKEKAAHTSDNTRETAKTQAPAT